ncbi:hypothetical protein [Nonlabens sp.]|uniref:DUF6891 domain-containing protein n=1 Tax=Nonlabens sp. TaxID=1888209 RepID=UPI0032661383
MEEGQESQILENIQEDISIGFYSHEDIYERVWDLCTDEGHTIDSTWLNAKISHEMKLHEKSSSKWSKPTDFQKLVKAFNSLRKLGVVSLHHAGFTKQEGDYDCRVLLDELVDLGYLLKGYCFYNEQDITGVIDNIGTLHIGFYSKESNEQEAIIIGQLIIKELQAVGFETIWNNSVDQRIAINNFLWQKTYDGIDYNLEEINSYPRQEVEMKPKDSQKPFWKFW